jgi:hypothetical protein
VLRQGVRNKEDVDIGWGGKNRTGVSKRITRRELLQTHNDTQTRLKLIFGREHSKDTCKASALGGVFLDSAISHFMTSY